MQSIREQRPDAVILDLELPDGNGVDVLRKVKALHDAPTVVILTNYPTEFLKDRSHSAGADYFFDKSTQFLQLRNVFQKLGASHEG